LARSAQATFSSSIGARVARKKKLLLESPQKGGKSRYNGVGPGYVLGIDEAEAEVIYEERKKAEELEQKQTMGKPRGFNESRENGESATKDTLSSFLKKANQTHKKEQIENEKSTEQSQSHSGIMGKSFSSRFNSPGSLYYDVNNNSNNAVNDWTEDTDENDNSHFKRVLRSTEEKVVNDEVFGKLYSGGLEMLNKRDELKNHAPLPKECTFKPRFETKEEEEGGRGGIDYERKGRIEEEMLRAEEEKKNVVKVVRRKQKKKEAVSPPPKCSTAYSHHSDSEPEEVEVF